jgi:hypothetical protein
MRNNSLQIVYFSLLLMFSVTLFSCVLIFLYPLKYPDFFHILGLFYAAGYLYVIFLAKEHISVRYILAAFIIFKIIFFVFLNLNGSFDSLVIGALGSDPSAYHLPRALDLKESGKYLEYALSTNTFNGRLTHIILAFEMNILDYFGIDYTSGANVSKIAFLFNTILAFMAIILTYKAALQYSSNIMYSRRAAWFLSFNPIFLGSTGAAKKEALLYFAVSLFLLFLTSKRKKIYQLVLSFCILILDRIYMVPLLYSVLFFYKKINYLFGLILIIFGIVVIELTIGFRVAFESHAEHVSSLTSIMTNKMGATASYLAGHDFFSNILRTLFGPAFFRGFLSDLSPALAVSLSQSFLLIFLYPIIALKSLFNTDGIHKMMLITYLFILILIPFHSTFKLFMVTALAPLFIDRISFIRYVGYDQKKNTHSAN